MKDIDKSFPGVHALDHVNFEVKRGEVHALMGENGAGKSTLMKVLTGIYQKDSGSIVYKGQETEFHNTREAQDAGVVIVHQELNMVGDLTHLLFSDCQVFHLFLRIDLNVQILEKLL